MSVRSATSLRSSASNVVTGTAGVRRTGSPKSRTGETDTGLLRAAAGLEALLEVRRLVGPGLALTAIDDAGFDAALAAA